MEKNYNNYTMAEKLVYITVFQLWWIAVWGIAYLGVEFLAKGSKKIELIIYVILLLIIFFLILNNPKLMIHLY
jgi:hypothetical protein